MKVTILGSLEEKNIDIYSPLHEELTGIDMFRSSQLMCLPRVLQWKFASYARKVVLAVPLLMSWILYPKQINDYMFRKKNILIPVDNVYHCTKMKHYSFCIDFLPCWLANCYSQCSLAEVLPLVEYCWIFDPLELTTYFVVLLF